MKIIKTFRKETKHADIGIRGETLFVEFFDNNKSIGEIEYSNFSYAYVESAAENWITGVMTVETIRFYQKTAA